MKQLVVIGGGEHARVVIEAATEWSIVGYVDREQGETARRLAVEWLGNDETYLAKHRGAPHLCVLGVGYLGEPRTALVCQYQGVRWATVVHQRAWVSPTATLGEGVVVLAGAVINSGARVGEHSIVNTGAIVEHDVDVGAFSHIAPGVTIGGGARIGSSCHLGLGSSIRDHVTIGAQATVGMGAVVVSNVASGAKVLGVPAKGAS